MKKLILFVFVASLLACSTSSDPEDDPIVFLSPSSDNISIGGQTMLDIVMDYNDKPFYSWNFVLNV